MEINQTQLQIYLKIRENKCKEIFFQDFKILNKKVQLGLGVT